MSNIRKVDNLSELNFNIKSIGSYKRIIGIGVYPDTRMLLIQYVVCIVPNYYYSIILSNFQVSAI